MKRKRTDTEMLDWLDKFMGSPCGIRGAFKGDPPGWYVKKKSDFEKHYTRRCNSIRKAINAVMDAGAKP